MHLLQRKAAVEERPETSVGFSFGNLMDTVNDWAFTSKGLFLWNESKAQVHMLRHICGVCWSCLVILLPPVDGDLEGDRGSTLEWD